jgi:hypothetical protein
MRPYEAGFDLTGISGSNWKKLLKLVGASETPVKFGPDEKDEHGLSKLGWFWQGKNVLIVSGVNPITSEHYTYGKRKDWFDYASYIGISSPTKEGRKLVVDFIKKNATNIKGYNKSQREYI